jgi:hypothetical protein
MIGPKGQRNSKISYALNPGILSTVKITTKSIKLPLLNAATFAPICALITCYVF